MALVRCSCIGQIVSADGDPRLEVAVADPDCGYVPHRMVQVLALGSAGATDVL